MEQSSLPTGVPQPSPGERAIVAPGAAAHPRQGEHAQVPMPEHVSGGGEQFVQSQGGPGQPMIAQPIAPPPVQPVAQAAASSKPADDEHPQIAEDVDVIEKEWIDKAKQIVNETRDDPRAQERKVSELQSVYLKKRYGKDIGVSEE